MQFKAPSGELIKAFLPKIDECRPKQSKARLNKLLSFIYNDLFEADRYVSKRINSNCLKAQIHRLNDDSKKPKIYFSRFFPKHIREYINTTEKHQLIYNCDIDGRKISIYFTIFSEDELGNLDEYDKYAKFMYMWLYICGLYSLKKCAKTLDIYIYLTPFTKSLPETSTSTLGPDHVNTAFTLACAPNSEMVIFRSEEWMKVFIHETFHTYGLDFSSHDSHIIKKSVQDIFPIDSEFNVEEAYAETWSRIINSAFCSYNSLVNKKDTKTFFLYMDFSLRMERIFSLYQCEKVLRFMGLTYDDLHSSKEKSAYLRKNFYREKTNVFAYYVLTAVFMDNYLGFLQWCDDNNTAFMQFNCTHKNMENFSKYIEDNYDSKSFKSGLECVGKIGRRKGSKKTDELATLLKTTRMSVIDTI
tara:strand:+ start:1670 stop:2914 length:1245 start_codon:yes stop_codon:yes gene_type:complete